MFQSVNTPILWFGIQDKGFECFGHNSIVKSIVLSVFRYDGKLDILKYVLVIMNHLVKQTPASEHLVLFSPQGRYLNIRSLLECLLFPHPFQLRHGKLLSKNSIRGMQQY